MRTVYPSPLWRKQARAPRNWKHLEQRKLPSKRLEALPVLTVVSKHTEARSIAVQRLFFLTEFFRKPRVWKEWMTLALGISTDFFDDALYQISWERIYKKCFVGSAWS